MIARVLRLLGIRRRKSIKLTHAYSEREARRLEMCRALFAEGKAGKVTL